MEGYIAPFLHRDQPRPAEQRSCAECRLSAYLGQRCRNVSGLDSQLESLAMIHCCGMLSVILASIMGFTPQASHHMHVD